MTQTNPLFDGTLAVTIDALFLIEYI